MNKTYKKYVNQVLRRIPCKPRVKKRIRYDLYCMLEEKSSELHEMDPYQLLGEPEDVADEFMDNMDDVYHSRYAYVSENTFLGMPLIQVKSGMNRGGEYKSERKLFGIPLVHINRNPFGVAKGIIAIGPVAIGIISLGLCSVGVLSLGVLCLGLLISLGAIGLSCGISFGGIAIAGLFACGGVAIGGYMAFGGCAIAGEIAIGGYARGRVAIGDTIHAHIGLYQTKGTGEYVIPLIDDIEAMKYYIFNKVPDMHPIVKGMIKHAIRLIADGAIILQ
ncbi:hypothetical protein HZI73_02210 [Vallitalea pronyensis]|uniref:Uncharacterized protein n=1 Tax=Vallitalea pronyensis TaxID=1348613 RepID=A0A8J8MGL3_9FIRM|nr:hypothetical protein [Vallitalea pronyensis]QUI21171.1 hypothetical protein HZI73_02210 [Vallitalea pronyensis]